MKKSVDYLNKGDKIFLSFFKRTLTVKGITQYGDSVAVYFDDENQSERIYPAGYLIEVQ